MWRRNIRVQVILCQLQIFRVQIVLCGVLFYESQTVTQMSHTEIKAVFLKFSLSPLHPHNLLLI